MSDIDRDSIFGGCSNDDDDVGDDGGSIRSIETLNRSKRASGSKPQVSSESIASSSQGVRIQIGHAHVNAHAPLQRNAPVAQAHVTNEPHTTRAVAPSLFLWQACKGRRA